MEPSGPVPHGIHAAQGDWPVNPEVPRTPGHEGVGIVERLGAGVTGLNVGDGVSVAWLGRACGKSRYCFDVRETPCQAQLNSSYSIDGALAEYGVGAAVGTRGDLAEALQLHQ